MQALRAIAFYLPQYHPIPENDVWWGDGFTEWTNVRKAQPRFPGHYQPHVPGQLGYYDLRDPEVRAAQAKLARDYGISGFCYYHYWFNGRRLLDTPLKEVLRTGEPEFPFCICWANENWTRTWDGQDQHVLMKQEYSEDDDRAHIRSLFSVFEDHRYIRINGKPLFLVYRTENMPDPGRTAAIWREEARNAGIGELYLARVESIGTMNPQLIDFDAAVEFAPDWNNRGPAVRISNEEIEEWRNRFGSIDPGVFIDNHVSYYGELADRMIGKHSPPYKWFRCVTPSWDNSARKQKDAIVIFGSTPEKYQDWLIKAIEHAQSNLEDGERIVFINGWNEWGEGNHLEPDIKYGSSYLEATRKALEISDSAIKAEAGPDMNNSIWAITAGYRLQIAERDKQIAEKDRLLTELQLRSDQDGKNPERQCMNAVPVVRINALLDSCALRFMALLRYMFSIVSRMLAWLKEIRR